MTKKGNILGGDNIGHCDKKRAIYWEVIISVIVTKKARMNMSNSEGLLRQSCLNLQTSHH